ncbi:MAG: helix-turn-helix transcriptional regulator [Chloroflexota bacterium]|nr:helix-turn-helix transcriptional regulator [Chloroflexota bacterium]
MGDDATPDPRTLFGLRVRELRLARQLSQEELADASGLHPTYISGIERGHRNVSLLNIWRLARALDVQPAELLRLPEMLPRPT